MSWMTVADASQQFAQTPLGEVVIALVSGSVLAMAGAIIKMMVDMSSLKQSVKDISDDIAEIKNDADTMRWSEYPGARRARGGARRERRYDT